MGLLKTFFKFFLIGLLVLFIFAGGCIGVYYAVEAHWALGIAAVVVFVAIIIGGVGVLVFGEDY